MKKGMVFLFIAAITFCLATTVWAVEFSADAVTTTHGLATNSKMYVKDRNVRMEMQGQQGYTIMRGDKEVVWMVTPGQKSYMEMKFDPTQRPKTDEKVQGEVSRKLVGSETIDKHPTQKFEVTYTSQGKTEKMYQWMATDIKFPVKTAAVDGSWTTEFKNIKMGGQSADLFEVPAGYQKMAMPAMPQMPKGMNMPKGMKMPKGAE